MDSTLNFSKLVIFLPSIEASKMSTELIISAVHCLNPSSNCGSGIGPAGMPVMFLIVASSFNSEQNVLNIGNNIFFPSGITQSRSASPVVRLPIVVSPGVPTKNQTGPC